MSNIHPTAIVEPGAVIGEGVTIEPYAIVKQHVRLGDHVVIKSHAYIDGHTTIGEGTVIYPSASIGTKTQDLKFKGEVTYVRIGKRCEIREFTTINSSCGEGSMVEIGDDTMIMAYCHVAHTCKVGSRVIMTNAVNLAGHVTVGDNAIIGGMTPVHQHVRIGCYAMVGGMARCTHDVPPYTIGGDMPYRMGGINMIGLKRNQFPLETRNLLAKAFRITYREGLPLEAALERIEEEVEQIPEVRNWVEFCRTTKRGLLGMQGITAQKVCV